MKDVPFCAFIQHITFEHLLKIRGPVCQALFQALRLQCSMGKSKVSAFRELILVRRDRKEANKHREIRQTVISATEKKKAGQKGRVS